MAEKREGMEDIFSCLKEAKRRFDAEGSLKARGLSESMKPLFAVSACKGPILYITPAEPAAVRAAGDLALFSGKRTAVLPARPFIVVDGAAGCDIAFDRIAVLGSALLGEVDIITAGAEALSARLSPPELFKRSMITFETGAVMDAASLPERLTVIGYQRVSAVDGRGQFAVRGGIIDIYPVTPLYDIPDGLACRIEFFDDEIDSVRLLDPITQRSTENIKKFRLLPASELIATAEDMRRVADMLRGAAAADFAAEAGEEPSGTDAWISSFFNEEDELVHWTEDDGDESEDMPEPLPEKTLEEKREDIGIAILDALEGGVIPENGDSLFAAFYPDAADISDYFPCTPVLDEPAEIYEKLKGVCTEYARQHEIRIAEGLALPLQEGLPLSPAELQGLLSGRLISLYSDMTGRDVPDVMEVKYVAAHDYHGRMDFLASDMAQWKKEKYRIFMFTGGRARGRRLGEELEGRGQRAFMPDEERLPLPGEALIYAGNLSRGFILPGEKAAVLSAMELYGASQGVAKRTRRRRRGRAIDSFTDLRPGEYVVHDYHGIALFRGITRERTDGREHDYLLLEYSDGGKLYVPVEQMQLVTRYIGGEDSTPRLNKLGGGEWARAKGRVRESVKEMAGELIELYAKRRVAKGYAFGPDTLWQRELEEDFEFEETPDQLTCIDEIKRDMESPHPMDRLLCGDVGYGKTEVAVRAAFKAISGGKQVAFLAPTTVLAQQHYNTVAERFSPYPATVRSLSRFTPAAEARRTLEELASGKADIVIGTHRLLSRDVKFHDLGLLIVDEEQRFGVGHKEAIKQLKENVDVLTLTATPIPRTLHMSMTGIRDMSVLETPPENRYEVQTYVMEYNDAAVRDAIRHEISRGGQVYFIYNRVKSIDRFAEYLRALVPEARIAVGHGQMNENLLEDTMFGFLEGKFDVLLCTTIIESGLDIPNANTLIVYDADRFGLAQLYQLRGRVGRSNRLAYAYMTHRRGRALSEVAEKRLDTILENTELGSGFRIAMRDLEIRGAGNLLGAEQHGHMSSIGYEMYCRIMDETIRAMQGKEVEQKTDTTLDLHIDAYIPEDYIPDLAQKLEIYKRIAAIGGRGEYEDMYEELTDRYGDPGPAVQRLLRAAYLKAMASAAGMDLIQYKTYGEIVMRFSELASPDPKTLIRALSEDKGAGLSASVPAYVRIRERGASPEALLERAIKLLERMGQGAED